MYGMQPIPFNLARSPYPASPFTMAPQVFIGAVYRDYCAGCPQTIAGVQTLTRREQHGAASPRDLAILSGLRSQASQTRMLNRITAMLRAARGASSVSIGRGHGGAPSGASAHPSGGHPQHRGFARGGGGWWGGYFPYAAYPQCYYDAAGNVVCWTPYGWQVVA
jgi:hypothetical protein